MKKLIHTVRSCRIFRPMTLDEAKDICLMPTEPMIRENEPSLKAALDQNDYRAATRHLGRMAVHARRTADFGVADQHFLHHPHQVFLAVDRDLHLEDLNAIARARASIPLDS